MEEPLRRSSPTSLHRRGPANRGTVVRGPLRSGRLSSCRSSDCPSPASATPSCPSSPRKRLSSSTPSACKVHVAPTPARQGLRGKHATSGPTALSPTTSPQGSRQQGVVPASTERVLPRAPRRSATVAPTLVTTPCDLSNPPSSRSFTASSGACTSLPNNGRSLAGSNSNPLVTMSPSNGTRQSCGLSAGTRADMCGKASALLSPRRSARTSTPPTGSVVPSVSENAVTVAVEKHRDSDVVLTAKLASRLLADLLEAYRSTDKLEDARDAVGKAWGFADSTQMTLCIEAQANASYCCAGTTAGYLNENG